MYTVNKNQNGATLIELLIGLALSLIVTSAMVVLMSNSLGTATRIIQMTQLTDDIRNSISMVSRDIRRANYSAHAFQCYANPDCGADGSTNQVAVTVQANCLIFNVDRKQDGSDSTDDAGGFRRVAPGGIGIIEMWVGDDSAACNDAAGGDWVRVSDPEIVNVTAFDFTLDDTPLTLPQESGGTLTQHTSEIKMVIAAELVMDDTVTRRIEDSIKVRNEYLEFTAAP